MLKPSRSGEAGAPSRRTAASRSPAVAPAGSGAPDQRETPTPHRGAATIALVQSSSLPMLVQKELQRMILAGDLAAGSKLNEASLGRLLGVSRGPVREAFRALEESGLVRLEKNRGVYVRQVSVEEADEIYELRALLDEFVGRRVAQTATPDTVRELRARVEQMQKAAAANDIDGYHRANVDFHDRLVELTGNRKLLATYRRLVNQLNLFRRATLAHAGTLPISTREHRDIVDRIASGNASAAGRALLEHVMSSRERMHHVHTRSTKRGAAERTRANPRKTR